MAADNNTDKSSSSIKDQIMADIAFDVRAHIIQEIEKDKLEYTGQLKNSWEIKKQSNGDYIIGSPLIWARVQDEGRLKGKMPPVKVLIPWVFQKIGGAKNEQELKSIAFAVARKIAEKGIEPKRYVKRALLKLEAASQ